MQVGRRQEIDIIREDIFCDGVVQSYVSQVVHGIVRLYETKLLVSHNVHLWYSSQNNRAHQCSDTLMPHDTNIVFIFESGR